jgi:hypothetical protein
MARRHWEAAVRQDDTEPILAIEAILRRAEASRKGGRDEQEGDGAEGGAEGEAG